MAFEDGGGLAGVEIPDPGCAVAAGGDGVVTVRAVSHADHGVGVAFEDGGGLAGVEIPDPGCAVAAGGDGVVTSL